MEVVLPTGEVMRTGMGALPGNNTWQLFPYGFGPYSDGIFTQSNFGIVTKMGVWLMPPPAGYQVFLFTFPREEDLTTLVDIIRPLRIANVIANVPHLRHALQECAVQGTKREWCPEIEGAIPEDVLDKMTEKLLMWHLAPSRLSAAKMLRDNLLSVNASARNTDSIYCRHSALAGGKCITLP